MKASTWTGSIAIAFTVAIAVMSWSIWKTDSASKVPADGAAIALAARTETPPVSLPAPAAKPAVPSDDFMPPAAAIDDEAEKKRYELIQADPALHERARQESLEKKAEARWQHAVDEGGYSADDLDPAIRQFFGQVDLEPYYAKDGLITGLVIQNLQDDHPLAIAGFRVGDRLNRIQGVELRYPEEIPSLLARLGPNFSVCRAEGESGAGEDCKDFTLH